MRTQSNARGLVALAMLGFLAGVPFVACSDGGSATTGGTTGTGGSGGSVQMPTCLINGVVEGFEACDDGNDISGDGCEPDCSFTCTAGVPGNGDEKCTDGDPCNGNEICTKNHTCGAGTPAPDNTDCGTGKVCKNGVCGDVTCGDMFVSPPEDCDDGNIMDGDGCDNDCTYSCASDPDCSPADLCAGQGTCDVATHICSPGTPLPDDTPCTGGFCKSGTCAAAVCGDSMLSPGEDCDDGNVIDGDGCDNDCTFSCVNASVDCPTPAACQMATCDANHVCMSVADPAQEGMQCGPTSTCVNGNCAAATCGNGVIELGEDCDFGMANGPGVGCELTCSFSCTKTPDSCPDANQCNGTESCQDVMVGGQMGQACSPGTPLMQCDACNGGVCVNNTCAAAMCGDSCVTGMEQCDPPGPNCSSTCTSIICGNSIREGGEQCDDGNLVNLDGCDANCKFEQSHRATWLKMQFGTDTYCTANQLGSAIGGVAQGQLQTALDNGVADGSIGILMQSLGLDDLTGTADPMLELGVMNGAPPNNMPPYDGTNDLDWWQIADPLSIDANRIPVAKLPASIAAKVLNGGPGNIAININIAGTPAALAMSDVKVQITIGATSTPLTSTGNPPGHLASENLDPALVSFASAGQKNDNGAGKLCGNVSAASLDQVPVPADLQTGGALACNQGYGPNNSLLDVLIGGCTVLFINAINIRQPDKIDPTVPQPGAGGPYTLTRTGTDVTGCRDKNNMVVNLTDCLNAAAYSSYFKLATGRVIVK